MAPSLDDQVASDVGSVGGAVVLVGEDEVPTVATVLAPVGDDVAGEPDPVLAGVRQQVTAASAVDADDRGFRSQHARSLATCASSLGSSEAVGWRRRPV